MLANTVQQTLILHCLNTLKKTTKIISQDYYTFESINVQSKFRSRINAKTKYSNHYWVKFLIFFFFKMAAVLVVIRLHRF